MYLYECREQWTCYGLDNPGQILCRYRRFFIHTQHLAWFRGQPSFIFNGYKEIFLWLKSGCSIRYLTTHLHLELRLRITVLILSPTIHTHLIISLSWILYPHNLVHLVNGHLQIALLYIVVSWIYNPIFAHFFCQFSKAFWIYILNKVGNKLHPCRSSFVT